MRKSICCWSRCPGAAGSSLPRRCSEDVLDRNWQRLVLTHLEEKTHLGVLTGSPITDMKITLVAGRAHEKHTEGGDFRQATYRAVRQGLMQCREHSAGALVCLPAGGAYGAAWAGPWRICSGWAAQFDPPQEQGEFSLLQGAAPVATLRDYGLEVTAYTGGRGRFSCTLQGYEPCHNQQQVVEAIGYDCQRDVDNTGDSVFCAHGAGFVVKWDQVRGIYAPRQRLTPGTDPKRRRRQPLQLRQPPARYSGSLEEDKELMAIYERTYGPIRRREFESRRLKRRWSSQRSNRRRKSSAVRQTLSGPDLPAGARISVGGWIQHHFRLGGAEGPVAQDNLDSARQMLMDYPEQLSRVTKEVVVILVFDAYKVPGGTW